MGSYFVTLAVAIGGGEFGTIQEIALAGQRSLVLCGSETILCEVIAWGLFENAGRYDFVTYVYPWNDFSRSHSLLLHQHTQSLM
jgi:hypothetical protein